MGKIDKGEIKEMRTAIMSVTIILCFLLTLVTVLTINSFSSTRVAEQTALNNIVDSVLHAILLDKQYNQENYEEAVNDILQLVLLHTPNNSNIEVKILEANTEEGLLDVEVIKEYTWYGIKKNVSSRRTVILEEFETPPVVAVSVMFVYDNGVNRGGENIIWREDATFEGAILKRPKNPKRQGYTFKGWSLVEDGDVITDDEWQNYIIPEVDSDPKVVIFYAVFEPNET